MIVLHGHCCRMLFSASNLVLLFLLNLLLSKETECRLSIRDLNVPPVVQNGTKSSIVLDCDYDFEDKSDRQGLVVKWYFQNNPTPVYQWIVGNRPQAFGIFKNHLNMGYKASTDEAKQYRAMMILNPTIELTGEYMCLVSNFENEVSEKEEMTVWVKEKDIDLIIDETIDNKTEKANKIRIKCEAEDVYPEPEMFIKVEGKVANAEIIKTLDNSSSLYSIEAFVVLDVKSIKSPDSTVEIDCELNIPKANYTANKEDTYEVNILTTTTEMDSTTSTTEYPTSTTDVYTTTTDAYTTTTDVIETTTDGQDEVEEDEEPNDSASTVSLVGLPLLLLFISVMNVVAL